ncbi:DNA-3-methyladenine glycosylase 2 [Limosilactobacillus allomucosae]|uniref:DNA-3-methyladenine glycosylase II n=1 Tax=Limosilactobacillus allomucosae TaxID=3142938 RepID=A0AAU7C290_9LACO
MINATTISVPPIFSWSKIIDYLQRNEDEITYQITAQQTIRKAFQDNHQILIVDISFLRNKRQLCLQVINHSSASVTHEIIDYVCDWFDLKTDLAPFYEMAKKDELLAPLIDRFDGLRLVGEPDFYEALTWCILGQQINLSYAYTLKKRFVENFGTKIVFHKHTFWLYPQPAEVAVQDPEKLRQLGMTQHKAEYMLNISKLLVTGAIKKSQYLRQQTATKTEKMLCKLRGIGPWTANYVAMRCLRYGDAFPQTDAGLLNGIKLIQQLDEKPSKQQMRKLHQQWGQWSSYATFYIWRLLY